MIPGTQAGEVLRIIRRPRCWDRGGMANCPLLAYWLNRQVRSVRGWKISRRFGGVAGNRKGPRSTCLLPPFAQFDFVQQRWVVKSELCGVRTHTLLWATKTEKLRNKKWLTHGESSAKLSRSSCQCSALMTITAAIARPATTPSRFVFRMSRESFARTSSGSCPPGWAC